VAGKITFRIATAGFIAKDLREQSLLILPMPGVVAFGTQQKIAHLQCGKQRESKALATTSFFKAHSLVLAN
jgi:hypothetical protein